MKVEVPVDTLKRLSQDLELLKVRIDAALSKKYPNEFPPKEEEEQSKGTSPTPPKGKEKRKKKKSGEREGAGVSSDVQRPPNPWDFEGSAGKKPPTLEEIRNAMNELFIIEFSAEQFFNFYNAQGWTRSNGKPMYNWRSELQNWKLKRIDELIHKQNHQQHERRRSYDEERRKEKEARCAEFQRRVMESLANPDESRYEPPPM